MFSASHVSRYYPLMLAAVSGVAGATVGGGYSVCKPALCCGVSSDDFADKASGVQSMIRNATTTPATLVTSETSVLSKAVPRTRWDKVQRPIVVGTCVRMRGVYACCVTMTHQAPHFLLCRHRRPFRLWKIVCCNWHPEAVAICGVYPCLPSLCVAEYRWLTPFACRG